MSRARSASALIRAISGNGNGTSQTAGAVSAAEWLRARGQSTPAMLRWHVEIALDVVDGPAPVEYDDATATRFHIDIYAEEWGVYFCHAGRSSWIRITDIAFVHGRDDYRLLSWVPSLRDVGSLLRRIEHEHNIRFQRHQASVRSNLAKIEPSVRSWLEAM